MERYSSCIWIHCLSILILKRALGIRDGHGWLRHGLVVPSLQVELPVDLLSQVSQFEEQFLRLGLQFSLDEKAISVTHIPSALKDKHQRDLDRNSLRNDISVFVQEAIQVLYIFQFCYSLF